MKFPKQCWCVETLTAYLQGRLSPREDAETRQHLGACGACRESLERIAGDARSWREAGELLADLDDADPDADDRSPGRQDKREGLRESLRRAGVDAHLSQWMGPTDDPAKMGRVGTFEVVGIIGIGGTGVVLKAHDARLNRYVALKVLLPALAHNAAARRRFERESRAVAAITHQNVVPIFAVDSHNGLPYFAMQYVGGSSLQQRLDAHGPPQVIEIVRIGVQVARALAAAHAQGVIHRDIKPANILLENNVDRVLVADFGLARVIDEVSTHSNVVTGTPQYMSPEQCHGEPADRRSDLFSLGSVLYAMCAGRPPFRAETLMGSLRKVCEATPRRIRERNADVPEWLEAFIDRLMRKDRDDRFPDASAVAGILEAELAHLQNPTAVAAPERDWMPPSKPAPRTAATGWRAPMIVATTALGAALLIALAQGHRDEPAAGPNAAGTPASEAAQPPMTARNDEDGNVIYESRLERTFDVQPGGLLDVRAIDGDITVAGGDSDRVRVRVLRHVERAPSEAAARAMLDRYHVDFESQGETVSIRATNQARPNEWTIEPGILRVVYEIAVPRHFNVDLNTSDGDIDVGGLTGRVGVTTSDGDVVLSGSRGEIRAESSYGHIRLDDVQSGPDGRIMAETQNGNVQMRNCKGDISAASTDGHIRLVNSDGTVSARTSDGDVVLSGSKGEIRAESSYGHIRLDDVQSGPDGRIVAETQNGNVRMRNCKGVISAFSYDGHIRLINSDGTVSATADGNIELRDCDGTLVAMAKDGEVTAENWTGSLATRSGKKYQ